MVLAQNKRVVAVLLRGAVFMALLCGIGTGAAAQDVGGALLKCASIADATQRLACYDALARAPELPAKQFGAEQLPRESNPATELEESITGKVTQLSFTPFGRFVLTLDNGQIWRQLDADLRDHLRANDIIETQRNAFGFKYVVGGNLVTLSGAATQVFSS